MNTETGTPTAIPTPGFADPTRDSQRAFRAILNALAHPGREFPVEGPPEHLTTLGAGLAAVALTLLDEECTVALNGAFSEQPDIATWLAFHTGAQITSGPESADFVITDPQSMPQLASLSLGSDEAPHQSATVVLDVRGCAGNSRLHAEGPGIAGSTVIDAPWATEGFLQQWQHNGNSFPRGVDLLLVSGHSIIGLPRTTRLRAADSTADSATNNAADDTAADPEPLITDPQQEA